MRVGIIGLGQAGGRIADLLTYYNKWGIHGNVVTFSLAVNSARSDLIELKTIPIGDKILIGQTEAKGHGVGVFREVGARLTKSGLHTIIHAIMGKLKEHIDAFLITVGLGGGTGSGGAPILAKGLKEFYGDPVYVLGIFPSDDEGRLMARNAIECVEELSPIVDGILFFDNNLWRQEGIPLHEAYRSMNHLLVKPLPCLFGAGEADAKRVGIKVVDAADIMASWKGFAVLGYSALQAKTAIKEKLLFWRKRPSIKELDPALRCYTVVKNALAGGVTARCNPKEAKRGLLLISGPKREINVEGFLQAKHWLEETIGSEQVRGGDYPVDGLDELRGIVLLSAFDGLPRLQELRALL